MQWGGYFRIPVEILVEHILQGLVVVVPLEVVVAALLVSASSFATQGDTCRPSTGCPRTLSSPSAAKTGTAPSWRNLNKHNATTLNGNLLGSRSHGLGSSLGPSLRGRLGRGLGGLQRLGGLGSLARALHDAANDAEDDADHEDDGGDDEEGEVGLLLAEGLGRLPLALAVLRHALALHGALVALRAREGRGGAGVGLVEVLGRRARRRVHYDGELPLAGDEGADVGLADHIEGGSLEHVVQRAADHTGGLVERQTLGQVALHRVDRHDVGHVRRPC